MSRLGGGSLGGLPPLPRPCMLTAENWRVCGGAGAVYGAECRGSVPRTETAQYQGCRPDNAVSVRKPNAETPFQYFLVL
jgi:hypothetical protein